MATGRAKKRPKRSLADTLIAWIESELRAPEGKLVGQPIRLLDEQKAWLLATFATDDRGNRVVRRSFLTLGRKNGKTALVACVLLAHLGGPLTRRNAQLVSGALARDQAALVYNLAKKMALQTPELATALTFRDTLKEIAHPASGSTFKALSSDGATAYGLSPALAIFDEPGQWGPQNDLYDALSTAAGAQEAPLEIFISTQAANDADLFSVLLDDAERDPRPSVVVHRYSAPHDADPWSPATWRLANPALGHFLQEEFLREWAERAKRIPSEEAAFRNLALNQRVRMNQAFISQSVWDQNARALSDLSDLEGRTCYAGLDLSSVRDLSSCVLVFPSEDDDQAEVHTLVWTPRDTLDARSRTDRAPYNTWASQGYIELTPGSAVDLRWVVARLAEICSRFHVRSIAYDRWRIEFLKTLADADGLEFPLVAFGQGFKDMAPALQSLEALLLDCKLSHGGNPVLRAAAASAVAVADPAGNKKFDKAKSNARIDPLVALTMAIAMWKRDEEATPNVYVTRERQGGFLVL